MTQPISSHIVSDQTTSAIDATAVVPAKVRYIRITKKFRYKYSDAYEKMSDRLEILDKNQQLVDYLRLVGESEKARKVAACGMRLVGNDPNNLKPEYYCQQTNWCVHCSSVLAMKRSEQASKASEIFSGGVRRAECMVHNLLISPKTAGTRKNSKQDLLLNMYLLRSFMKKLKQYHGHHDLSYFQLVDSRDGDIENVRKKTWGPTISSIHLVPPSAMKIPGTPAIAHMHLAIVTSREGSKVHVTKTVKELWEKTKQASPYKYVCREEEVLRDTSRKSKKQRLRDRRMGIVEDSEDLRTRLGQFRPGVPEHPSNTKAAHTFAYLARSFKLHWSPQAIVEANQLLEDLHIEPSQLYQRLGMLGVKQKQLPCEFANKRLKQRFVAEYTPIGWEVFFRHST